MEGPQTKTPRVIAVGAVGLVLVGLVLVREPLADMFGGRVSFNWVGYAAFISLTLASLAAVALITRARRKDASFRGVVSELTRLTALGEAGTLLASWGFYLLK
jgi:hypothetical protein